MLVPPVPLVAMLACHDITGSGLPVDEDELDSIDPTDSVFGDDDDDGPGDDDDDAAPRPLAGNVRIAKVSLFQGVEAVLVEDGEVPTTLEVPVIVGRPGELRVFLEPEAGFQARRLTAVLDVISDAGTEQLEETERIAKESTVSDPDSTINFWLDGDQIARSTEFHLEIVEAASDGPGGGTRKKVVWDSEDLGGLDTETTDELRIVLIPIRYDADGSGRLPDTSPTQRQRYEDLMMGIYPATNVVVEVGPVFPWNRRISRLSTGDWADILQEMNELRDQANEPPNTYYYGVFEPASSLSAYCGSSCILGMSLLAYNANDPYFRASVGIGYTGDMAAETMAHEVGHAHGRDHAPCGTSGDRDYPYPNARLGSWGYSVVTGESFDPNRFFDVLSYCSPYWVSDYNFWHLMDRMNEVARQARLTAPTPRTVMRVIDGAVTRMPVIQMTSTDGAPRAEVELFDADGRPAGRTTAAFFPYDHANGGVIAFDGALPDGWTAQVVSLPERL